MLINIRCMDCGKTSPYNHFVKGCRFCSSDWLNVEYDYDKITAKKDSIFNGKMDGFWKYRELLPIMDEHNIISLGEGGTPLIYSERLSKKLGIRLYIKDESQNPNTNTFKDRGGTLAISGYKEMGVKGVVVFTTGNIGMAYSCYGHAAGLPVYVFLPNGVKDVKMDFIKKFDNVTVFENQGDYDDARASAIEFAKTNEFHMDRGVKSIFRRESKKTVALEMFEQMDKKMPDWYFQPISGGLGALGVDYGYRELIKLGYEGKPPKLGCIQIENCCPMVSSFKKGTRDFEVIKSPDTPLLTLATGNPVAYPKLYDAVKATNGTFEDVSLTETKEARTLLWDEGVDTGLTSSVAMAGIVKLAKQGMFSLDDCVIFLNSGGKDR